MAKVKVRKPTIPPFSKIADSIRRNVAAVADQELKKLAIEMRDFMRDGIRFQRFASFQTYPLTKGYVEWKVRMGLDRRVLISTGQYVNNIVYRMIKRGVYEVNVPENIAARDHKGDPIGLTLRVLGAIHEFGSASAHVPPRRHWRDGIQHAERRAQEAGHKIAVEAARRVRREMGLE